MLTQSGDGQSTANDHELASRKWVVSFVATLFGMMALQMSSLGFAPVIPLMQQAFKMSYSQVGLFTGLYGILALVLSVPAGLTAKQFGEKIVMVAGVLIVALGLVVLSRADDFVGALAGRIVWIAGYRFAFVCVLTALAVTCPPSLRGRTMGILGAMSSLATVVGAPFVGSVAEALGWRNGILGFAGAAVTGAIVVGIFYSGRSSGSSANTSRSAQIHVETSGSAFRTPRVWALAVLLGLVGLPSFSVTFFVPSAAESVFRIDTVSSSLIISSGYLAAIFVNLGVGYLMDRFNKWRVMSVLMTTMVAASLGMTAHNLPLFRICTVALLAFGFAATNQGYGLAADVLRGRESGNVMGVVGLGAGVFGYVGPQALGLLRDWTGGFSIGWYVVAGICLVTVAELYLLKGHIKNEIESSI
ncbi:MAG: MFS transporter [Candidatus Acidiferrales bacterium]